MLAVGLATFNGLYCTQALLPTFTSVFGISPTVSALTISATTGTMAVMIVPASILSERFGRGRILVISLLLATAIGLTIPFLPNPAWIIGARGLQGAFFAGAPAVAMTWLSEEIHKEDLPASMGLYIAGNSVGGLIGRLIPAGLMEVTSWRWAMGVNALVAFSMAVAVWALLPQQRNFRPKQLRLRGELKAMAAHWQNGALAALFIIAMLEMGAFVSMYNYLGYRLIDTFGLSEGLVGLLFVMYLSGTWSAARAGRMARRWGRGPVLLATSGLMMLPLPLFLIDSLTSTLLALLIFTAGFFALHSTASSWVGLVATKNRAEASSMFLFCYYFGSSLFGWLSGYFFHVSFAAFLGWLGALTSLIIALGLTLWRPSAHTGK